MKTFDMKTIGLLGGLSPESTVDYYRRINAGVNEALGGHHSARLLLNSVDLDDFFRRLAAEDYDAITADLGGAALALQGAGADFVMMACNTAHVVAPRVAERLRVPLIHIADVLGEALVETGFRKVGLLGARVTMEAPFYRDRLESGFAVETLVPAEADMDEIDRVIREELCFNRLLDGSRERLETIAGRLRHRGAEAIVLGCTELGLLLDRDEVAGLPAFDTTLLHVERAVDLALGRVELELPGPVARAA